jgi:PIN domain nuclease of toxin-antitoxin system
VALVPARRRPTHGARPPANGESRPSAFAQPASIGEIAIKISIGKYRLDGDLAALVLQQLAINRIEILPISIDHVAGVSTLPFHHREPFDRLLIAQALIEQGPLISSDAALDPYGVVRYW